MLMSVRDDVTQYLHVLVSTVCAQIDITSSEIYILTSDIMLKGLFIQEPLCDQIKDLGFVPREDSDQARHLQSLIKSHICALKK